MSVTISATLHQSLTAARWNDFSILYPGILPQIAERTETPSGFLIRFNASSTTGHASLLTAQAEEFVALGESEVRVRVFNKKSADGEKLVLSLASRLSYLLNPTSVAAIDAGLLVFDGFKPIILAARIGFFISSLRLWKLLMPSLPDQQISQEQKALITGALVQLCQKYNEEQSLIDAVLAS